MPELQTELPLAVKQLLDITEDTPNDYEPNWKFETTQNNANKTKEKPPKERSPSVLLAKKC